LRIVIVKLSHERATDCGELMDVGNIDLARLGEEYRAEIRFLDLKPFDSYGFGSLCLSAADFYALDPAKAYELTIAPITPALFFGYCHTCDALVAEEDHSGICDGCIPF